MNTLPLCVIQNCIVPYLDFRDMLKLRLFIRGIRITSVPPSHCNEAFFSLFQTHVETLDANYTNIVTLPKTLRHLLLQTPSRIVDLSHLPLISLNVGCSRFNSKFIKAMGDPNYDVNKFIDTNQKTPTLFRFYSSVTGLPTTLEYLAASNQFNIPNVAHLPLKYLDASQHCNIVDFPHSLRYLNIAGRNIWRVPPSVEYLDASGSTLVDFPPTLKYLNLCNRHDLVDISHLTVYSLDASGSCRVVHFPAGLRSLNIANRMQVFDIGHLALESLNAAGTCCLVNFPTTLRCLNIQNRSDLREITLPLHSLNASGICGVGIFPTTLRKLNIFNRSDLKDISHLNLTDLDAGGSCSVTRFPTSLRKLRLCQRWDVLDISYLRLDKLYVSYASKVTTTCRNVKYVV